MIVPAMTALSPWVAEKAAPTSWAAGPKKLPFSVPVNVPKSSARKVPLKPLSVLASLASLEKVVCPAWIPWFIVPLVTTTPLAKSACMVPLPARGVTLPKALSRPIRST